MVCLQKGPKSLESEWSRSFDRQESISTSRNQVSHPGREVEYQVQTFFGTMLVSIRVRRTTTSCQQFLLHLDFGTRATLVLYWTCHRRHTKIV